MTYVIEMRNEVADGYEYRLDRLNDVISDMSIAIKNMKKRLEEKEENTNE